jgi:hypothetical protein
MVESRIDELLDFSVSGVKRSLAGYPVTVTLKDQSLSFNSGTKKIQFTLAGEGFDFTIRRKEKLLPLDILITAPGKVASMALSRLGLNKVLFARKCELRRVGKSEAAVFLNTFHFLNATTAAVNTGLYFNDQLFAVASFSGGRKMDRLPPDKRSFELVRFCSRSAFTVAGGLTRLVKNFYIEKNAGDIMTYVDKQFSDGNAFVNAGFRKIDETPPVRFLVHRKTFERIPLKEADYDRNLFYYTENAGNLKMVYKKDE